MLVLIENCVGLTVEYSMDLVDLQNTMCRPFDGLPRIGVIENDSWAFAAKLQCHFLQVRFGCSLENPAPGECASCKRDLPNQGMG